MEGPPWNAAGGDDTVSLFRARRGATLEHPAVERAGDRFLLAWPEIQQPSAQVFAATVDARGVLSGVPLEKQQVTVGMRGSFEPWVWNDGGLPVVLFHSMSGNEGRVDRLDAWAINRRCPEPPGALYVLGYQGGTWEETIWTFLYLQLQALGGSAGKTMASVGALLLAYLVMEGLGRLGCFGPSPLGRQLRLLAGMLVLWLLKHPQTMIYFQPVLRGPFYECLTFVAAAGCTFGVLYLRSMSLDEEVNVVLALTLCVFWDYYFSTLPSLTKYLP